MDNSEFKVPENCLFLLHSEKESVGGSLDMLRGEATIKHFIPGEEVEIVQGETYVCVPNSWTMLSTTYYSFHGEPVIVSFRGKSSAYCFKMTSEGKKLIFGLRRFPSERYMEFYMTKDIQILFTTNSTWPVRLERISDAPEVFGSRLVPGERYKFMPLCGVVVSTFTIGKIRIYGTPDILRIAPSPCNSSLIRLQNRVDALREAAFQEGIRGPRVLVYGPRHSRRTSFCQYLLNDAVRRGRRPVFVDLNIFPNSNTIPGALSVLKVNHERHITEGFQGEPRILPYGRRNGFENSPLYLLLVKKARDLLELLATEDAVTYASGAVIDIWGFECIRVLRFLIQLFGVTTVVAMGKDDNVREYLTLLRSLRNFSSHVFPNGHKDFMEYTLGDFRVCKLRTRQYFYGSLTNPREPSVITAKFSDVRIFAVTQVFGQQFDFNLVDLERINVHRKTIGPDLLNQILAVSAAENEDRTMALAEAKYFVCVTDVDTCEKELSFLSPNNQLLTGAILLLGEIRMI